MCISADRTAPCPFVSQDADRFDLALWKALGDLGLYHFHPRPFLSPRVNGGPGPPHPAHHVEDRLLPLE